MPKRNNIEKELLIISIRGDYLFVSQAEEISQREYDVLLGVLQEIVDFMKVKIEGKKWN